MACCGQKGTVSQATWCPNFLTLRTSWLIPAGIACSLAGRQRKMSHGFHLSSVQVLCFTHYLVPTSETWHTCPCHRVWASGREHEQVTLLGQQSCKQTLQKCHLCILESRWSPTPEVTPLNRNNLSPNPVAQ